MNRLPAAFFFILASICIPFASFAQLKWDNVDSLFGELPPSVNVFRSTTPVDGKPNISYYVSVDLDARDIDFTTQVGRGKRFTPSQFYEQEGNPVVTVNGTFFSFADNRNLNLVIRNGMQQAYNTPTVRVSKQDSLNYYYLTRSAIGINKKRKADVAWVFTDTALKYPYALLNGPSTAKGPKTDPSWPDLKSQLHGGGRKKIKWKMETAIGGGPMLVQMGKTMITNKEERMFVSDEEAKHPRTAMGYTKDGRLIILAVEGRHPGLAEGMSLAQEAKTLAEIGCWEALNLDGGGSSCLLVNGKPTITPSDKEGQRPVPAVFMVKKKQ
jgi:hypothetical protein